MKKPQGIIIIILPIKNSNCVENFKIKLDGFRKGMVLGALTHCTLLHSLSNLKVAQMKVQCGLTREFVLYEFELGHNTAESAKEHLLCES